MPLEALMQVKVRTATLLSQSVADAPAAVVVLTAKDIEAYGWRTLADALASLPGLYTSYDRTYSYLGGRGFQRPGDYNSRFLLLIDGMRVNDTVYDQAPIGDDFPLDMDLVERIEYVPGPGSAVYGSNALFGVINVVTKKGSDINGTQVAGSVGSFGEKRARASYGWHGDSGADLVLSATGYDRSGQDLYYPEFDTPDQNNGVAHGLDYDRAQYLFAKFAYQGFKISAGYGSRTKGVPTAPYQAIFNTPQSTSDAHSFIDAKYRHAVTNGLEIASEVYWERYDYQSVGLYGQPPVGNVDGDKAIWYGADVHATVSSVPRNKFVVGISALRDAARDQYNYNADPYQLILDDRRSSNSVGLYAEDEIQLPWHFTLNAGVRIDHDSNAGTNVSPRLALNYKPTDVDTFKLLYGRAYRAPNAYELYYTIPVPGGQLGNSLLKPERIATTEFIYERAFGENAHATVSLFHYDVRDLITETPDPSGVFIFENVNHATANGVELAYEQDVASIARIRASYSWQLARDSATGGVLQNSPRHLGKLNVTVPLLHNAARVGAELRCESARLAEAGSAAGYCLGNVTIGSERLIPHADVSFSVYNVTDKRYADPAGPNFTQNVIPQQSRTFLFKLVYGF
ncbi:TonB-dependent receptor [Trinickia dabaoshanensis]|uniref:TonB-dependent receptor n=1 Tax=Trinickia dabaoshanensis TaxID=564714 RepID=A0A2N7W3N2_9BURK|nr:TonB-dependent receptor [Trinickia dabaoshanensis]PMS23983.1 TonB-dependent receptor [Trinickia dabaoshanensis]